MGTNRDTLRWALLHQDNSKAAKERRKARTETQALYDSRACERIGLKLNQKTDADIIAWLHVQKSMQGAIKALIRAEIARVEEIQQKSNNGSIHQTEV